ncbi:MAG TPA: zinc-ribbon domain-containing protein [Polyangiaceae bacterium]|nr:zinc-ribbon domain-containing protein [Polyangiaceae bacterium]
MEVRCSSCSTEYEFDDALVSARGTSVKCTNCGHQFRVHAPAAAGGVSEKWIVRDGKGKETLFTSLRELQQAIVRGLLDPKHEMSHGNQPFRPLQDIYELQTFFDVARHRAMNQRQPPRTLLGVGRDAVKPSRQSVPPPRKPRPEASAPVQDRVTPIAGVPAVDPPVAPARSDDDVRVPTETGTRPLLHGANAALTGTAGAGPVPTPQDRAALNDRVSQPLLERISQNPLEPPLITKTVNAVPATAGSTVPWQHLQGLQDEPASNPLGRSRGAGSRWIVALLVLGTLALVGGTVGREYLVRFVRREPPAPVVDQRVPALLEQARGALARGDFETAHGELAKASVLAETDPDVAVAQARLEVARAEPVWLRLKISAALEAAAAQKAQSRKRKPTAAEVAAEADQAEKDAIEKKQLELAFQDRMNQAKASVSSAMMRAPNAIDAVRAKVDSLRLAGQVKDARALVGPLANAASDPDNAYSLGALDVAEGDAGLPSALDRLRTAARTEEALGKARALLIYALAQSGDATGASAELGKLQTLAPQHPALAALKSLVELAQSKVAPVPEPEPPRAAPASTPAPRAEKSGNDTQSLLEQAGKLHREGDLDGAEKVYQSVLARSSKNVDAISALGDIARERHNNATAAAFYDQALKLNRNHVPTLMGRADMYWASGNRILAVALYRRALAQVSPSDPVGQRALKRIEDFDRDGAGTGTGTIEGSEPDPSEANPTEKEPAAEAPAPAPAPSNDSSEAAPVKRRLPPIGGVPTGDAPAPLNPSKPATPSKPAPVPGDSAETAPGGASPP